MKLVTLAGVVAYSMHVPWWAVAPTGGAGATKHGERANRPGVEALYLALVTASEHGQLTSTLPLRGLINISRYDLSMPFLIDLIGST